MLTILIIFDSSFIVRYIFNQIYYKYVKNHKSDPCLDSSGHIYECDLYEDVLLNLITQYFWDYIPILLILLFHKNNFKQTKLPDDSTLHEQTTYNITDVRDEAETNESQLRKSHETSFLTGLRHERAEDSIHQNMTDSRVETSGINSFDESLCIDRRKF